MEKMEVFGNHEHLVGWYFQPEKIRTQRVAVVMLTAGMLHHIGPMRLHVQLGRHLADAGLSSLRFNLSGIGESLAVGYHGSSCQRAGAELKQALDWLQNTHGFEKFVLFGLCSGADDALNASLAEPRIVGLSLMDGCAFRTPRFHLHRARLKHLPKMGSTRKLLEFGRRAMSLDSVQEVKTMPLGEDIREHGDRTTCHKQIVELLRRRVRMQWIYTGGAIDYYSYAAQFDDMFPNLPNRENIQIHHLPQIDHLATLTEDRKIILGLVRQWCASFED